MTRRQRGTGRGTQVLTCRVGVELVQLLDLLAERMGCSRVEALELAIEQSWEAEVMAAQARRKETAYA